MSLLVWIFIAVAVYIGVFNVDFTKETIDKVIPFIIAIGAIILALSIIYNL